MKIYAFLATGFEEVEALGPIDVCRRAGLDVITVSIMDELTVVGAHGVGIVADSMFADNDYSDADMLFLPGGMPGATNLNAHEGLRKVILAHHQAGKALAAICAAPMVYGNLGLAQGKKMTCYPGFEEHLHGATLSTELVVEDCNLITGRGPGAAMAFGYAIATRFAGEEFVSRLKEGMIFAY